MKILLFAVLVLFAALTVSCEQKTNPAAEYGDNQVGSYVATTLRYYVDVFPEDMEEAAEMLTQR